MNARCTDVDGGFNCSCRLGFIGDGHNCTGNNFLRVTIIIQLKQIWMILYTLLENTTTLWIVFNVELQVQ